MCYAIPGRVTETVDNMVTVDYLGETRRARNELDGVKPGDYVYAQGGFIIQTVPEEQAKEILKTWEELLLHLQQIDLQSVKEKTNIYQTANAIRQKELGNACCVHGIIEFSNICKNNCLYCGIRRDNAKIQRYRMSMDEIVSACDYAVNTLGFKALVLQSGEDETYTGEKLAELIEKIKQKCAALIIVSVGEKSLHEYRKIYDAGARGALLRFETSNEELYGKLKPESTLTQRLRLIQALKEMGFFIMTGFLTGLPGQTEKDIENDMNLCVSLQPDMITFGPFIPHPKTPLASQSVPDLHQALTVMARLRTLCRDAKIVVTTALETLDKENGARMGLLSGGNSMMINVTPQKYRQLYEIYPNRESSHVSTEEKIGQVIQLLHSLGRAPTDLGI